MPVLPSGASRLRLRRLIAIAGVFVMLLWVPATSAQEIDESKANRVKATMVVTVLKYVKWPAASFETDDGPLIIGIVGEGRFADAIQRAAKDQTVRSRPIRVRRIPLPENEEPPDPKQVRACHLLFVNPSAKKQVPALLESVKEKAVLTVSDIDGFAVGGGVLELAVEAGRYVFRANRKAAEATPLKLSAKLLHLARIVEPPVPPEPASPEPAP